MRNIRSIQRISRRNVLIAGAGLLTATIGLGPSISYINRLLKKEVSIVVTWNNMALQAIRELKPGATIVARVLAILHTCMFDAWAAYDPVAHNTRGHDELKRPSAEHTLANKTQAVSYAACRALEDLFPTHIALFYTMMQRLGYDPTNHTTDTTTAIGIGNIAAQFVLTFRHTDGSNQLGDLHPGPYSDYTNYTPVNSVDQLNNPDLWQPLRVSDGHGGFVIQSFMTPQWPAVIPFSLTSGSQFRPPLAPPHYTSTHYRDQNEQIIALSASLTDKEKVIAEYWKDGPASEQPPGHWCLHAQFVSQRDQHTLDQDIQLFFILANTLLDASIACWDTKRAFQSIRPISAIHYLFHGQKILAWAGPYKGTRLINGEDWQPYQPITVVSPPFPEYFSGHSTFSAAAAEILRRFTNSDHFGASAVILAGSSVIEPKAVPARTLTLSWNTFSDAADEAGISRRYGGIHFEDGDLIGRRQGRAIGAQAWQKAQSYIYNTVS
jgi:Domain of unknown function (DUF6851)/VCPO second helical-bundle domain